MTITKQIVTGNTISTFEFAERTWNAGQELLMARPLPEILAELASKMAESKSRVSQALAEVTRRNEPLVQEKQTKLDQAIRAVIQEREAMRADINAGLYASQPGHEAAILELEQKALEAEISLYSAQKNYAGERTLYLRPVVNNTQNSGSDISGLDYREFANLVNVVIDEWLKGRVGVNVAGQFQDQYQTANNEAVAYQDMEKVAKDKLEKFKLAARERFSGSLTKPAQSQGYSMPDPYNVRLPRS